MKSTGNALIPALVRNGTERRRPEEDVLNIGQGSVRCDRRNVFFHWSLQSLFAAITASLRKLIQHEYPSLALHVPESSQLRLHALDFPVAKGLIRKGMQAPIDDSPAGLAFTTRKPVLVNAGDLEGFHSPFAKQLKAEGVRSACLLPLITQSRILGTLNLASRRDGNFTEADVELLRSSTPGSDVGYVVTFGSNGVGEGTAS